MIGRARDPGTEVPGAATQHTIFAYYNFARRHMTLKETPAMASGLENHVWSIRELIEESAKF